VKQRTERIDVATLRGLTEITTRVRQAVHAAGIREGLCTVFLRHTSASLVIQENADPSVRADLTAFFDRLVPDGDPRFTHVLEGADDMPAHVKSALLSVSLSIPVAASDIALGTWQGIFVWEHRSGRQRREVLIHVIGE
jgi:secondary thiamine-phosphate synthase enzyme